VHPTYAKLLCITLRGLGVDVDAALRKAHMPSWAVLATSVTLLDQDTISHLIAAALEASGKPWLGIEVGSAVQVSAHGPLGNAAVASNNLEQALETVARFGGVRYGAVQSQLFREPDGVVMAVTELVDLGASRTFVTGMVFATLLRMMEAVVGHRLDRIEVEFPFPEPHWRGEIERLCAGRLHFNKPQLAFHLDNPTLLSPCITADTKAFSVAYRQCEQLEFQSTLLPLKQRVSEMLNVREGRYPSLSEVAKHFGISERTMMRRLKHEGSSYQASLDATRQQRALWYLTHSNLAIEAIAGRLGFEDTSNFSRIFKRWFGCLPSETRRAALEELKKTTADA
jgi:AraC-like DNA-binding protein